MFMKANPDVVLSDVFTTSSSKAPQNSDASTPNASVRRAVPVPMGKGEGTFVTFDGLEDSKEHIAIVFASPKDLERASGSEQDRAKNQEAVTPLVRIHSECLTGDVFQSGKCDCGEQLNEAIELMNERGGILLYLRQEGRGIGLYNKLDAYHYQRQGFDTYEANRMVGYGDDLRDYTVAAQMLKALGVTAIQLLSNNPDKRDKLRSMGIEVQTEVSTGVFVKESNRSYLAAKVNKTGHRIALDQSGN
jgi:GTP cyclohydrolase II